jgi:hypothetical protein
MGEIEDIKSRRLSIRAASVCVVYLFLTIFYYHIDKYLTGVSFISLLLLIPIAFLGMIDYFIKGLAQIYSCRRNLSFRFFFPAIFTAATLTYTIFCPYRIDSENLQSKVRLKAFYKGTQNDASLKFREDKSFELHWTGVFGYDAWYFGTYSQNADTFYLNYTTQKPIRFGDTIVNDGECLVTRNKLNREGKANFVDFCMPVVKSKR